MNAGLNQKFLMIKNVNELEHFIGSNLKGDIIDFPRKERTLNLRAYSQAIATSDLWFCSYGTPITLQFPEADYFRIQFHVNGHGSTQIGRHKFEVSPNQVVISSSNAQIHFGNGFQQNVLRINREKLAQKLFMLSGIYLKQALDFEPAFDSSNPNFHIFMQTFGMVNKLISSTKENLPAFVLAELEQTLLTTMLCSIPHNYSSLFENQSAKTTSREVRIIEEYIEANWNEAILIEDLVAISGCSARSIFRAFKQSREYTPLEFVKTLRLRHARRMLLNSEELTVTQIAFECGFPDLGRFSRDYAKAFGEFPSHTLKKSNSHNLIKHGSNRLKLALTD